MEYAEMQRVSIPDWFDQKDEELADAADFERFYSRLVRLEEPQRCEVVVVEIGFYSRLVRLEDSEHS